MAARSPSDDRAQAAGDVPAETDDRSDEEMPMNRAARRSKGKKATTPPPVGKIVPGRVNQGRGHRSYANRRSG
jgi:hypothetical protein